MGNRANTAIPYQGQHSCNYTDVTLANSTAQTSVFQSSAQSRAAVQSLVADDLVQGTRIVIEFNGIISTLGSGPGTLSVALKYGSTTLASVTSATLPTSLSNTGLDGRVILTVTASGSSGTASVAGYMDINNAGTPVRNSIVTTSDQTINTTTAGTNKIDCLLTWSVNSASNTLTINHASISIVDP